MSDEGLQIRARRERGGWDKAEVAKTAGVHRNTISAIERGDSFNRSTLAKIERALTELEREAGMDAPPAVGDPGGLVEIEVDGSRVIVRGPVSDKDALAEMVARLIRDTRESEKGEG